MEMSGEYRIPAPKAAVWRALNDPEVLKASIAGCESVEKLSDTEFAAVVTARIGPVSAKFRGKVTLSDLDPPNGCTISGEGQGGVAGFGKGSAKVTLSEVAGATVLRYDASAQVGGKLAQIGARLVDGAAKKMADDFFATFAEKVGGDAAAAEDAPPSPDTPAAVVPEAPATGSAAAQAPGLSPAVWVTGLIAAVAIVLVLLNVL
ncbi:MAG: carbon monoxide dehydrogenase subunit G [Alphaproteobacteria bacterium]|nr:carbon monoxide dehydrogenase subunit G [Alphaproteobacteria bacterium]